MAGDPVNAVMGAIVGRSIMPLLNIVDRHLGYLFRYKNNIKKLGKAAAQLGESRDDAVIFFEEKKWNNEEATQLSFRWLEEVKEVIEVADEVKDGTTNLKGCLNLKGRYVLSRKSTKLVVDIKRLQNKAPKGITTNRVLPAGRLSGALANKACEGYSTRMETMVEVKNALGDGAVTVIGICGLPGVGKTTMVHEVRAWAKENNLIDDFAMTSVSKDQNLFKIQSDLAEMLGLTELKEEKCEIARADQLYKRLTNGNKILVVLDDVWRDINLKDVGIPSGSELTRCKVVITSRHEGVCSAIQKNIKVNVLAKEEARALFRKTAGEVVKTNKLEQIADDVADKCGGLPIALLTLASTLSKKDRRTWEDALAQLRKGRLTRIKGIEKSVYDCIKLSYDFLASEKQEEAQSLLLLCCQHQEDEKINVEKLAQYCLSLKLFKDVTGVVEARNRTYSLIENLKSCFLLESADGDHAIYDEYADRKWRDEEVKVHDVVRDVCLSIVSRLKEERDQVHMQIIEQETDNIYHIDATNIDYPKVKFSVINNQIIRVFQMKGELRVLECVTEEMSYTGHKITPIPEFQVLANLRMLYVEGQRIHEDRMGELMRLKNLEILSFSGSTLDCLPSALGQLSNLKLLDLRCFYKFGSLNPMPGCGLGGLTKLEVLYMGEKETCLSELDSLTNLTTLQILTRDPGELLDLKHFCFDKLKSFFFGSAGRRSKRTINYWSLGPSLMKTIEVEKTGIEWVLEDKIQPIVSRAVELCLDDMKDWTDPLIINQFGSLRKLEMTRCNQLKYIISDGNSVFKNLEILKIKEMSNVTELCHNRHLAEGSLYKLQKLELWSLSQMIHLWVGPTDPFCLLNLTDVTISGCSSLKCIFPHSAIKCLSQLVNLNVSECDMLMGIVSKGGEGKVAGRREREEITEELNDSQLHFRNLRYMTIIHNARLQSFCNLGRTGQPLFNSLVMLPSLEIMSFSDNDSVKAVFDFDGLGARTTREDECSLFPELAEIELSNLSELEHLCRQIPKDVLIFQNLRILSVENCGRLLYLIPSYIAHLLVNLERLDVKGCAGMKEIFCNMNEEENCGELKKKIVFRSLCSVMLEDLDVILWFCSTSEHLVFEFPSLETISIIGCPKMETFCCQKPRVACSGMLEENVSKREGITTEGGGGERKNVIRDVVNQFPKLKVVLMETFCCQKPRVARNDMLEDNVSKGEGTTTEGGGGEINIVSSDLVHQLPKLKEVVIQGTPNFRGLLDNLTNDEGTPLPLCYQLAVFPRMEKLTGYELHQLKHIVGGDILSFAASDSLNYLKVLDIRRCNSLMSIFDCEGKQTLEESTELDYEGYQLIREDTHAVLSKLERIFLIQLPNLEHICRRVPKQINGFRNLRSLRVYGCHSLSYLLTSTTAHMLLNLKFLMVWDCKSLEQVIKTEEDCGRNKIVFRSLSHVEILSMEKLSSFCANGLQEFDFPELDSVYIVKCPAMSTFCHGNLTAEKLQGVYLDDNIDDDYDYEDYFDDNNDGDCAYDSYDVHKVVWKVNVNETVRHFRARNKINQVTSDSNKDGVVVDDEDNDDADDVEEKDVDDVGDESISENELKYVTARHQNPMAIQYSSNVKEDSMDDFHSPLEGVEAENDQCIHEYTCSGHEKPSRAPFVLSSLPQVVEHKTMEKFLSNRHEGNLLQKAMAMTTMASYQSTPGNEFIEWKDMTGERASKENGVCQNSRNDAKNESGYAWQADNSRPLFLWRGHKVTSQNKNLLEWVEKHFPSTYVGVNFHNEGFWQLALDTFCCYLSKYLGAVSISDLSSSEVAQLRDMLLDLETFKFNLHWALDRLDKVEKLRFGKELAEIECQRAPLLSKVEHSEAELALAKEEIRKLDVLRETKLKMLFDEFGNGSLEFPEGYLG